MPAKRNGTKRPRRVLDSEDEHSATNDEDMDTNENPEHAEVHDAGATSLLREHEIVPTNDETDDVDTDELIADSMEHDADANGEQRATATTAPASNEPDNEFIDDIMAMGNPILPPVRNLPEYYTNDYSKIPDLLRNAKPAHQFDLCLEICDEFHNVIFPNTQYMGTQSGVSKSFVMHPSDDDSTFVQPYEGASFTFVDR
jgi:hypothetical protein